MVAARVEPYSWLVAADWFEERGEEEFAERLRGCVLADEACRHMDCRFLGLDHILNPNAHHLRDWFDHLTPLSLADMGSRATPSGLQDRGGLGRRIVCVKPADGVHGPIRIFMGNWYETVDMAEHQWSQLFQSYCHHTEVELQRQVTLRWRFAYDPSRGTRYVEWPMTKDNVVVRDQWVFPDGERVPRSDPWVDPAMFGELFGRATPSERELADMLWSQMEGHIVRRMSVLDNGYTPIFHEAR